MRKLYGRDVLMADVVAGRVPLPPEVRFEWRVQLRRLLQVARNSGSHQAHMSAYRHDRQLLFAATKRQTCAIQADVVRR